MASAELTLIDYFYLSSRPLIFYGSGVIGQMALAALADYGIRPDAFCDGNTGRHGSFVGGVEVTGLAEALRRHPNAAFVISANPDNAAGIHATLLEHGVGPDHIFPPEAIPARKSGSYNWFGFSSLPYYDAALLTRKWGDEKSERIYRLRYRHWLLGDRRENPDVGSEPTDVSEHPGSVAVYRSAEEFHENLCKPGGADNADRVVVEFDNDDETMLRAFFAFLYFRPNQAMYLDFGPTPTSTLFYGSKGGTHGG